MQIISLICEPAKFGEELKFKLDMKFLNSKGETKNILVYITKDKMTDINKVFGQFLN